MGENKSGDRSLDFGSSVVCFSLSDVARGWERGLRGFPLGSCDTKGPDPLQVCENTIRGRSEVTEPESSGCILGTGGGACSDLFGLLTNKDREPSWWLIGTESESRGAVRGCPCDTTDKGGDGARIKDSRL